MSPLEYSNTQYAHQIRVKEHTNGDAARAKVALWYFVVI